MRSPAQALPGQTAALGHAVDPSAHTQVVRPHRPDLGRGCLRVDQAPRVSDVARDDNAAVGEPHLDPKPASHPPPPPIRPSVGDRPNLPEAPGRNCKESLNALDDHEVGRRAGACGAPGSYSRFSALTKGTLQTRPLTCHANDPAGSTQPQYGHVKSSVRAGSPAHRRKQDGHSHVTETGRFATAPTLPRWLTTATGAAGGGSPHKGPGPTSRPLATLPVS